MTVKVSVEVSSATAKWLIGGACFLGALYLFWRLVEDTPDNEIPLPIEAKSFAALPQLSPTKFEGLNFHPAVKESARASFYAGDYASSVRAASLTLYDIIRKKSGIEADATTLIQKVFRGERPVLKFTDIAQTHISNAENGLIEMLEGFSKSIRKIHMHSNVALTEANALQELSIICYLAEQVEQHTVRQSALEAA